VAEDNFRLQAGAGTIFCGKGLDEIFGCFFFHQIDGAATKTCSGQAGAKTARQVLGNFDQCIQFRNADLL